MSSQSVATSALPTARPAATTTAPHDAKSSETAAADKGRWAEYYAPPPRRAANNRPSAASGESDGPDAERWARVLAVALADVLAGRREARSVQRWMTPEIYRKVCGISDLQRGRGSSLPALPMVSRVFAVNPHTVEFAVVVWEQTRARAIAGRLVRLRDRWHLSDLSI